MNNTKINDINEWITENYYIVYHGSDSLIDGLPTLEFSQYGSAIFVTPSSKLANSFAGSKGNVNKLYLDKSVRLFSGDNAEELRDFVKANMNKIAEENRLSEGDDPHTGDPYDYSSFDDVMKALSNNDYYIYENSPTIINEIKRLNYDGTATDAWNTKDIIALYNTNKLKTKQNLIDVWNSEHASEKDLTASKKYDKTSDLKPSFWSSENYATDGEYGIPIDESNSKLVKLFYEYEYKLTILKTQKSDSKFVKFYSSELNRICEKLTVLLLNIILDNYYYNYDGFDENNYTYEDINGVAHPIGDYYTNILKDLKEAKTLSDKIVAVNNALQWYHNSGSTVEELGINRDLLDSLTHGVYINDWNKEIRRLGIKKIARVVRQDMSLPILKKLVSLGYNRAIWNIHEVLHKEYDICDHYNGEEFDIVKMISNLEHDSPIFETSHVNCFKDDVEVYTNEGWKLFKDLNRTEMLATINPETLELEYQKPFAYIDREHKGKMIRLHSKNLDISQTLEHRMFVKMTNDDYKIKTNKQYRFITYDKIIHPLKTKKTEEEIRKFNGIRNYGIIQTINYNLVDTNKVLVGGLEMLQNEYAMFMGYYLSEGCCRREEDYGYQIDISQTKHRVKMFSDLKSIFNKYEINVRENSNNIEFNHKGLCEYLRGCGKISYEKVIPKEVFTLNKEALNIFLDAYILGDGSVRKTTSLKGQKTESIGRFIYTTSKKIADGLTDIGLKAGYAVSYKTIDNTGKKFTIRGKEWETKREIYRISLKNNKVVRRYKIEEFDYDGRVYCASVPNTTLLVRSNGKVTFSGNCLCNLVCYSTTNSELDHIVINWQGGYDEGLKLDREDKTDRRNKWQQKFNEYRAKLDDIRNNQYITGVYSEPDSGIYSFDYTIYGDANNYYYQQNNIQELNDRVLDIILTTAQRYKITVEDAVPSAMHYVVTTDNSLHDYDFSITDFYELDWVLVKRLNWLNELMYELNNLENWLLECNRQINDLLLKIETNQNIYQNNKNQQQNMNNQQQPSPYDIDINDTNNEFFK